jgi:hypothetical protein
MAITMEIPGRWLAEIGLGGFMPPRSAIRCAAPHELLAIEEIEPLVRSVPIDANGFRRSKMMSVLELIRDDVAFREPIYVARKQGRWPYCLRDGVHRYYASRTLGFTHVPAEIVDPTY